MSSDRSAQGTPEYLGYRCIASSTGLSSVALGTEGQHTGVLSNFFASPYEDIRVVYALMELVLKDGANQLTICANPFLASFFEQFGFEAVCMLAGRDAPPNWIPEACKSGSNPIQCPDFVFMARKIYETSPVVTAWMSRIQNQLRPSGRLDGRQGPCANCVARIASEDYFDLFGGYKCRRCGFIYAYGALTVSIPRLN
jgi:hypothetical protein